MSGFAQFMKSNKKKRENVFYPATKSLQDENGKALLWEVKPLSSRENEYIREQCMEEVPVVGKPNMFRTKFNTSRYLAKLICASVVNPDLNDAELQDSYGANNETELLYEMIDSPGEYQKFAEFIQSSNGFDTSLQDKINEAKN